MEYGISAWAHWPREDIDLLDRVYHKETKLVDGLQNIPYQERLRSLDLLDFTQRRIRSDLILTFKILKVESHPLRYLFQTGITKETRRHSAKLIIPRSRVDCRRHFYSVRVCFLWNSLPEYVVSSSSLSIFKSRLDLYLRQTATYIPTYSSWHIETSTSSCIYMYTPWYL